LCRKKRQVPNLTKTLVEGLKHPDRGQAFAWDDSIKGFGVRVTPGGKTFILDRKPKGRSIRLSIGRFPAWSVQQAREEARRLTVEMDKGVDPRQRQRDQEEAGVTLAEVFERFMSERELKDRTRADYRRYLEHYLPDWKDKAISRIDAEMIMARYKKVAASSSGGAQASSAMRFLRSVMNFAQATYGRAVIDKNPVASITAKKAWLRENARTDHLRTHEVKPFVEALRDLPNPIMGAYLETVLLTGARRSEAATLRWKDVDFRSKTLTFHDTKNHTDRTIPLTERVAELLNLMAEQRLAGSPYVFSTVAKSGRPTHIVEPRKAMARANEAAGSAVTVHGLRRSFATILESLDCPGYPLKALLGHSLKGDVTSTHYTQLSVERLRPWLEKYEQHVLKLVGDVETGKVISSTSAMKQRRRT
jgi:integrase